jgi:predicted ATP-grasp superfamily ATP-dependent carboligase
MSRSSADTVLIAAVSGRALAASAARGGWSTIVLDCFADLDTRAAANAVCRVADAQALRLDGERLLAAAETLAPPQRCAGLVCGSGFEDRIDLLEQLARGRRLYGNAPATIREAKDPDVLFPLLDELGIAHPGVSRRPPADPEGWLVKRVGGAGGLHVRPALEREAAAPDTYFQRFAPGVARSVLFLADGRHARIVGFNEQLPAERAPYYQFGGLLGRVRLPAPIERQVRAAVERLTVALGLVGLNGIDFLQQPDGIRVLEVNPRPTAAIDLYDRDWANGLFDWHLRACEGELPAECRAPRIVRGQSIFFAHQPIALGRELRFPRWCSDIPTPGSTIRAGEPVCTIHAIGSADSHVRALLAERKRGLQQRLAGAGRSA